jgi:hypothetical protein
MASQPEPTGLISPESLKHNAGVTMYARTVMGIVGGCCAGILGLTGFAGFAMLFATHFAVALGLLLKMGMAPKDYVYNGSLLSFAMEGLTSQLTGFILFWTLSYGLVWLY